MAKKSYRLAEIAEILDASLQGDGDCKITAMASIQNAQPDSITFLLSPKYEQYIQTTKASAIVVSEQFKEPTDLNVLKLANPQLGYAKLATLFDTQQRSASGIHSSAVVAQSATIDPTASIGPNVVVGDRVKIGANTIIGAGTVIAHDCVIGESCLVHANVTLYHGIKMGVRIILHSGVVLGADGFGLINDQGAWQKIPQLGSVQIGNDVEIGANTTIDRGAIDDTIIEQGVKLDNQIMIAHNVKIGAHTAIAGQAGIAGSTTVGRYCMIGGQAGIVDHVELADQVILTAGAQVSKSLPSGIYSSGMPVETRTQWHRSMAHYRRMGELAKRLKRLEKLANEQHQD